MAHADELFRESMALYDVTLPSGEQVVGSDFVVNEALRTVDPSKYGKSLAMSALRGAYPDALTGQALIEAVGYSNDTEGQLAGESLVRALVFGGLATTSPDLSEQDQLASGLSDIMLHPVSTSDIVELAVLQMNKNDSIKFTFLHNRTPQYREAL